MKTTNHKFLYHFLLAAMIGTLIGCSGDNATVSFTADVITSQDDKELTGKLYYKNGKYRAEMDGETEPVVFLVDEASRTVWHLKISEKSFVRETAPEGKFLTSELIQFMKHTSENCETRFMGTEEIGGVPCEKVRYYKSGIDIFTGWTSPQYPIPLKIIEHIADRRTLVLNNIKDAIFPDSLLILPDDYVESSTQGRPESAIPRDSINIIEAEVPASELVKQRSQLEVKLDTAKSVTVRFKNLYKATSICNIAFYKNGAVINGSEIGANSYGTVTLKETGFATQNTWQPGAEKFKALVETGLEKLEVTQPE